MDGVAVLQPQDVRVSYRQPVRSRPNSNRNPVPNPNPKKNRRKNGSANFSTSPPHLVMGEVKILKRGEVLTNQVVKENKLVEDLVLSTTDWPDRVPKKMNFYAGSAFVSSPPPSSLPVPAFFNKKTSDASTDLRRILRMAYSVILDGGPARVFALGDAKLLEQNLEILKEFFISGGEGLPRGVFENQVARVRQVIKMHGYETKEIIEDLRSSSELEMQGGRGKLGADTKTLLRILCHRGESEASQFVKKQFKIPKSGA